ncbi:hypothetical protein HF1_06010 [Mycoplasma haemofelis str. Langford 1]|uniref:Uncharacterized protein n=1 Tax=Mycoplasma haemofelis (strain Langford 1) TaxID=941640 RepID=E8ZHI8_MYCHL|nr:hypothetical protein [Mycoplasma haemofelis]CBY92609.1 hypothetical protein HF1_06010 [Mycoplasma haemofelis str. Langford 1]
MKLAGVKFLAGGATAASATGLGALGVSSMDWKEKPKELTKTKSEDAPVTPTEAKEEPSNSSTVTPIPQSKQSPVCKVFKIENKDTSNPTITEIQVEQEKQRDTKADTDNKQFWTDVDTACKGTDTTNKPSYEGKVYVTKNNDKWVYSKVDQKQWLSTAKK